ncbi:MAG: hypothetical protein FWG25_04050 [Promicromonosporaceae bacterium]|nr:hypothetical protein [Promicromonosporaceae bacterium]
MTTAVADATRNRNAPGKSLTALDRCDRCNAQAYVRVTLPVGELLFCGHHSRAHAPAYSRVAVDILDESDRLKTHFRA